MKDTIKLVEHFHKVMNHPIGQKPNSIPRNRVGLRLALILEELNELSIGYGCNEEFHAQLQNVLAKPIDYSEASELEQLDAYCDLQYVLNGAIIESGMQNIINSAFNEVHRSNMSKVCKTKEEVDYNVKVYEEKGIKLSYEVNDYGYVLKNAETNKVIKPLHYSPANLKQFLDNGE